MSAFNLYTDAALTIPFGGTLTWDQQSDGSTGAVDKVLYLGCPTAGLTLQAASAPGTAQITVSIADLNAGDGEPTTSIKLALTQGGLSGATGGAPLNLGTAITGLAANAKAIWMRFQAANLTLGTRNLFTVATNSLQES